MPGPGGGEGLRSAAPGMDVASVVDAIAFYERVLGFRCVFRVPGDDPPYAVLRREGVAIHLRRSAAGAGRSFCYLEVADADRLAAELQAAGATFARRIEDSPYGMRDFEVVDCCGNVIGIGASLPG